jgi:hypothetical protein
VLNVCDNLNISLTVAPQRKYPYFDVVVGLALSNDPESYSDGSDATRMASRARQVKGDDPDPGLPSWGLVVTPTSPRKVYIV